MDKMLNIISTIPLFNGLPEDQIVAIKKIAVEKKINKGEIIFSEGDEGNGFFVVADGRVKVFKVSTEGKEQILHIFGSGQPFGEEYWTALGIRTLKAELEFNRNAGFTSKDDRLPKMFYEEPLPPTNKVVVISDEQMDSTFDF